MSKHEDFEQLCALMVIGQLSPQEHAELIRHLGECAPCRATLQEMRGLAEVVPAAGHSARRLSDLALPRTGREFRDDFIARARLEGIHLSAQSERKPSFWAAWPHNVIRPHYPTVALVACLLTIATLLIRSQPAALQPPVESHAAEARIAELTREIAALRHEAAVANGKYAAAQKLTGTLGAQHAAALEKIRSLEALLAVVQTQAQGLEHDLTFARADAGQLSQRLTGSVRALDQVRGELEGMRAGRAEDQALLAAEQRKVEDLSEKLRLQVISNERERELLAAGKDIRDLMGARDLHIIDVHDFDVKGKRRKSFGRIFLTEGRSLIFYAFDLGDPKVKNASFQAWGHREANGTQAINLGIFYADDQSQSRWVLKFNNPDILREIDSVFVTVEPPGGGRKPTGQKLLYAYLNTDANHP